MQTHLYLILHVLLPCLFVIWVDGAVFLLSPQQASVYPDPLVNVSQCQMDEPSFLCDPDQVLAKSDRNEVHRRIQQLFEKTQNSDQSVICKSRGISLGVAISQRPLLPPAPYLPNRLAEYLHTRWGLDRECEKAALITFSNETRQFTFAVQAQMPLLADEMAHILMSESFSLNAGHTLDTFLGIINSVQALSNHRANIMLGKEQFGGSNVPFVLLTLLLVSIAVGGLLYWLRYHQTDIKFTQMGMSNRGGIDVEPNAVEYNRAGDRRW